jgi:hypothetical protein
VFKNYLNFSFGILVDYFELIDVVEGFKFH